MGPTELFKIFSYRNILDNILYISIFISKNIELLIPDIFLTLCACKEINTSLAEVSTSQFGQDFKT